MNLALKLKNNKDASSGHGSIGSNKKGGRT